MLAQLEELRSEVSQLQQEAAELKRRLGLDSANSGKPPSSDGYGKKPRPVNLREKTDKKSGGQAGHEGKNLRQVANPDKVVDHCPCACAGWNRSSVPGQRCRVVVGSNPPTTAAGLWVILYWAPWLDPMHPYPAKPGELTAWGTMT